MLIVFDAVLVQEFQVLLLERPLVMMLALMLNVMYDLGEIRFADSEGSVSILPGKTTRIRELFVNPFRRIAFEKLGDLTWREDSRSRHYDVNVVFNPANLQRRHSVLARDAAEIGP